MPGTLKAIAGAAVAVLLTLSSTTASADCVFRAQGKRSIVVLDRHTILLSGGFGADIILNTFSSINRRADIFVLRDNFCSFAPAVLSVDGRVIAAARVVALRGL